MATLKTKFKNWNCRTKNSFRGLVYIFIVARYPGLKPPMVGGIDLVGSVLETKSSNLKVILRKYLIFQRIQNIKIFIIWKIVLRYLKRTSVEKFYTVVLFILSCEEHQGPGKIVNKKFNFFNFSLSLALTPKHREPTIHHKLRDRKIFIFGSAKVLVWQFFFKINCFFGENFRVLIKMIIFSDVGWTECSCEWLGYWYWSLRWICRRSQA